MENGIEIISWLVLEIAYIHRDVRFYTFLYNGYNVMH
jgi:hypothetical protein